MAGSVRSISNGWISESVDSMPSMSRALNAPRMRNMDMRATSPSITTRRAEYRTNDPELVDDMFPCLPIHDFAEGGSIAKEFKQQMTDFNNGLLAHQVTAVNDLFQLISL